MWEEKRRRFEERRRQSRNAMAQGSKGGDGGRGRGGGGEGGSVPGGGSAPGTPLRSPSRSPDDNNYRRLDRFASDSSGGGGGGGGGPALSSPFRGSPVPAAHSLREDVEEMRARVGGDRRGGHGGVTVLEAVRTPDRSRHGPPSPSPASTPASGSAPGTPSSTKSEYLQELEAQMALKRERREREKREQEEWDRRKDAEASSFDYFGRSGGGGGAPIRDAAGNIITSRKEAVAAATAAAAAAAASAPPAPRRRGSVQLAPLGMVGDDRRRMAGDTPPATPGGSSVNKSEYLRDLEAQIAEKAARKEHEKRELEEWHRRKDQEAAQYDYFGAQKGGGGTPMKPPGSNGSGRRDDAARRPSPLDPLPSGRLPSVRGDGRPSSRSVSPLAGGSSRGSPFDTGGGGRWPSDDAPLPSSRAGSVASRGGSIAADPAEMVELYRDQNQRLKADVAALEDKLEQALGLLEQYRELYGPLPAR